VGAVTVIWVLLIGGWLAVAAERYFTRARRMSAKERAFVAESTEEAHAIQQQREALKQAINTAAAAQQGTPSTQSAQGTGLAEVTMRPNDQRV